MSTRGLYGIRKGEVDKCTYNHCDSYPDGLGRDILQFCATHSEQQISDLYNLIELFNTNVPPTEEQKAMCKINGYVNLNVSSQFDSDWYCLLRELQGNIDAWDEALKQKSKLPMEDDCKFIKDSLFCEYAYIINLDTHVLEFWRGFQTKPNFNNRYGFNISSQGVGYTYYPCNLIWEIKLLDINLQNINTIVDEMEDMCNEDEN